MALFWAAFKIDSVSFLKFPFHCHVLVFSYEISIVCRLKYPHSCFSSQFCFLVVVPLNIMLSVLFLVAISLSLPFFTYSSNPFIDTLTLSLMLTSPLPISFLDTNRLCHFLDARSYASLLVFLSFGSFVWVLYLSILKMVPSILLGDSPGIYPFDEISAAEIGFEKFSRSSETLFFRFSFISTCLMVSASNIS